MKLHRPAYYRLLFAGLCLLVLLPAAEAQYDQPGSLRRDSLRLKLSRDSARIYRRTIARPYLRLERRNSIVHGYNINLLGFLAGAYLHERHIVAAGFYEVEKQSKQAEVSLRDGKLQQFASLSVINFCYQYIFLSHRYIQLQWPIEFGYGSYNASVKIPSGKLMQEEGHFI